jgi:hypothetical protein
MHAVERKPFFFEKKNQKTLVHLALAWPGPTHACCGLGGG